MSVVFFSLSRLVSSFMGPVLQISLKLLAGSNQHKPNTKKTKDTLCCKKQEGGGRRETPIVPGAASEAALLIYCLTFEMKTLSCLPSRFRSVGGRLGFLLILRKRLKMAGSAPCAHLSGLGGNGKKGGLGPPVGTDMLVSLLCAWNGQRNFGRRPETLRE